MKRRAQAEADAAVERYAELLRRYHSTLDLMSDAALARLDEHLVDAERYVDTVAELSPAPTAILDVGSGAGLPGVVLAACLQGVRIELVERRRRRGTFLRMAVAAVGAEGVLVRVGDVQQLGGPAADVVVAQAVATLTELYRLTRARHAAEMVLVSRKGPDWRDEVKALEAEIASATEEVAAVPLSRRGTLVAVRVQGGRPCRSSA